MTDPSKSTKLKEQPSSGSDPSASVIRRFRVRTEDSAFVYSIFEASEGVCAYSTLPNEKGDRHRDLEMVVPVGQLPEFERILTELSESLAGEMHVLTS
jgi:hypothetical protein